MHPHHPHHLSKTMLKFSVPRGHDGFWEIMTRLQAEKGEFSVPEIDAASNVSISPIRYYVKALEAGGFVEQTRTFRVDDATVTMFRICKPQRRAPRIRKNGSVIADSDTQLLWTAIRSLGAFGNAELRFAAQTDPERPITEVTTKAFIGRLVKAGYLAVVKVARRASPGVWRLKKSMDTGPLPPRRLRINCEAMWDDNLKEVVGEIVTQEPQP